jgi:hypothetical protein
MAEQQLELFMSSNNSSVPSVIFITRDTHWSDASDTCQSWGGSLFVPGTLQDTYRFQQIFLATKDWAIEKDCCDSLARPGGRKAPFNKIWTAARHELAWLCHILVITKASEPGWLATRQTTTCRTFLRGLLCH